MASTGRPDCPSPETHLARLRAKGASHNSLGQRPRKTRKKDRSAESAFHHRHATVARPGHSPHHFRHYGAFSVSRSQLDAVTAYVEGQEEHHQKITFHDEYRGVLKKHGIEFDERYVWD